jgi:methyl-accepting chemotaxis protein
MLNNQKLGTKLIGSFIVVAALTLLLGGLAIFNMLKVKHTSTDLAVEVVPEVAVANEVERWSLHTMYETRGYAFTEEKEFLDKARANLGKVKDALKVATDHAEKYNLEGLRANARRATEKAAVYEQLLNETVKVTEAMEKEKATMNTSAAAYMKACEEFIANQEKKLHSDVGLLIAEKLTEEKINERIKKTVIGNDVVDLGNSVRIGAWKSIAQREPTTFTEALKKFPLIDAKLAELKTITHLEADLKDIADCKAAGESYRGAMERFLGNWLAREELGKKRNAAATEVLAAAEDTAKNGMKNTSGAATDAATALTSASNVLIVGCVVCVILGLSLGIIITRSITKPIKSVADALSAGAEQTAAAARQVSSSSQSLAEGSSEQAASLEETSASLEEISGMTKRNAESATQAKDLAGQTRTAADAGAADMEEMKRAMDAIKGSSDDISKIIKTIDEIAFQTNILALNAAVEAARAGEAGMGFAVVAEEVRNLAQRSAQSAKETAGKIEDSVRKSEHGVQICGKVAQSLNEIVGKARQVDTLVAEIAQASREQTQGIEQVNTAVSQMDKVTQSNAAGAEESAAAAEELSAQSVVLQESVAELISLVDGSHHSAARSAHAATPVKVAAVKGARPAASQVVRPSVPVRGAAPARGQEKLSFSDGPGKPAANGHHSGAMDHFEN